MNAGSEIVETSDQLRLSMSVAEYGKAIRAAYQEGYIEASTRPRQWAAFTAAKRHAMEFWRIAEIGILKKLGSDT